MISPANLYGKYPVIPLRNGAVGTGLELLTDVGADVNQYNIMDRETTVSISSSSTDDDGSPAGTGARTVTITGYDRDLAAVSETVTMNGQTAVATTATFMVVTDITVATSGAGGTNAGDLYVIRAGESTLTAGVPDTLSAILGKLAASGSSAATGYFLGVSSSSTADDGSPAGTGALTLTVYGVDDRFEPISETCTLNGRTMVTGTKRFRRVHAAVVATVGTGRANAGDIYVFGPSDSVALSSGVPTALTNVLCKIPVGMGQGFSGLWTTPKNTQWKAKKIILGASGAAGALALQARGLDNPLTAAAEAEVKYTLDYLDFFTTGPREIDLSHLPTITQLADIELRALSAGTGLFSALLFLERVA